MRGLRVLAVRVHRQDVLGRLLYAFATASGTFQLFAWFWRKSSGSAPPWTRSRFFERALAISEKALGPEHPDTARSLNNLGLLLKAQGDVAAARPRLSLAPNLCCLKPIFGA
jgi:hypothetical protein